MQRNYVEDVPYHWYRDPDRFGGTRDEPETFEYSFRFKFRANEDWYPSENMKFDYAFFCLKGIAQSQILPKMVEINVFKIPAWFKCQFRRPEILG